MSIPDGHLVRRAFLTKYGYPPDLTYEETIREFELRYDHAQEVRQQNAGLHRIMLIIEGMSEGFATAEASHERQIRSREIERLTAESGYGAIELDLLAEGFAARLEAEWIRKN